ncbi:MAG TPA: condensation domain-containing protein, partial [Cyclobacteriaceae bacterium]|nr:condensation domain-containing protein [Cyclobacteriaceae bacterium]
MSDISSKKKSVSFDPFAGPEISRVFPLTESQIEIWLSCTLGGDHANIAYNESNSLRFQGALDVEALAKAVGILTERHESLRCSFSKDGKNMLVYKDLPDQFLFQDISGLPAQNKEAFLKDHLKRDALHNFDLVSGPLFKATLLKLGEQEYHFTFTAHHIIIDGWSIGLIMEELGTLYSDIVQGKEPDLPDPYPYSDYANEQREFLNSEAYKEVENFWLDQYKDKVPVVNLPTDHARPLFKTYASNRLDYELEHSLVKAIRKTGIESGCTLVNTILGALEVFLSKVTGQKDIIIGVPASGQAHLGYHQLLGHCVNLLPLRSQPDGALGFGQYLSRRKPAIFDAYENQQLTFGSLLKNLKVPRDTSRVPLVPVVFNVDFGMDEGVDFHGLKFKMISNPKSYLNFEWFLNINGSKESVVLEWTYNRQLFEADTMNKMVNGFVTLLKSVTDDPDRPLDSIEIFVEESPKTSPGEEPVLYAPDFSEFQPMHSLFELAAEKYGERPAVVFRDTDISYRALNENANQLAHFLAQQGLKRGEIVGIVMDRSIEMLVAALGILKAGCAYLPVDTDYPNGRIEYYLNDGAKMHITQKIYQNKFNSSSSEIIWEDFIVQKEQYPKTNPNIPVAPHDKAYIIYTSGSTGGPKGVILEHDNLFNFLVGVSATPGIAQEDRVLAVSSFSFDIAIQELILPLVHG